MKIRLEEMAMSRSDAIDKCMSLGKQFTKHFNKIVTVGKNDKDFKHHCNEMQTWLDTVKGITFKSNNKKIPRSCLFDWFFTCGGNIEDIIADPYCELYEDFVFNLLNTDNKILSILQNLL